MSSILLIFNEFLTINFKKIIKVMKLVEYFKFAKPVGVFLIYFLIFSHPIQNQYDLA